MFQNVSPDQSDSDLSSSSLHFLNMESTPFKVVSRISSTCKNLGINLQLKIDPKEYIFVISVTPFFLIRSLVVTNGWGGVPQTGYRVLVGFWGICSQKM